MKKIDSFLLLIVAILCLFGLLIIYDASSFVAFRDFSDKYHYIKEQFVWMVLGFAGLTFFALVDYHRLYNFSLPILIVALVLLILVFVPKVGLLLLGARRWLKIGSIVIQPAEFVKLALSIYLAAWFSNKEKKRLGAFILLLGLVIGLIMLEPDMGTATIIFFEALTVYFISGANPFFLIAILPVFSFIGFILIKFSPYRTARLSAFLDSNQSIEGTSYHVRQILIALGMGGITGVGLGNSLQKYAYLPENTTDSIFAIIGEELGFIGATILILFFAALMWRGFLIATRAKDLFGKLLASSIITFLIVQTIINLGAQTALIPLTGVPLPFISYGGSSLIVDLSAIGILLNISRQKI